jgi:hypothetical protein
MPFYPLVRGEIASVLAACGDALLMALFTSSAPRGLKTSMSLLALAHLLGDVMQFVRDGASAGSGCSAPASQNDYSVP